MNESDRKEQPPLGREDLTIRKAGLEDVDGLLALEDACFPVERRSNRRSVRRSLSSPTQSVWMAFSSDGALAGALFLHHHSESIRIYSIAVWPKTQSAGVGSALVSHTLSLAKDIGGSRITLEADSSNMRLLGWYARFGFVVVKELPNYYSPGFHAVRMALSLGVVKSGCNQHAN